MITEVKLDFKDVLLQPKRSTLNSRSQVDLKRDYVFKNGKTWTGTGIVAANMDHTGTFEMAKVLAEHGLMTALHKHYPANNLVDFYEKNPSIQQNVFYAMGITKEDYDKFKEVNSRVATLDGGKPIDNVVIDVANGYSEGFLNFVSKFKKDYPDTVVMAGNVVTGDMTQELILSGVDIVKVGIGPGSVCTTRVKTGVGYPQLSAIMECADAAHGVGGFVCADGGCTVPGDVAKAFGAGADFVMLGGMLSGHDECNGEVETEWKLDPTVKAKKETLQSGEVYWTYEKLTGEKVRVYEKPTAGESDKIPESFCVKVPKKNATMRFYGMSSEEAQQNHGSSLKDYRASEGKSVDVPYRGSVSDTLQDILGGLRSACTYTGARRLKDLPKCTTFVRCTQQENQVFSK